MGAVRRRSIRTHQHGRWRNAALVQRFIGRRGYAAVAGLRRDDRIAAGEVVWDQLDAHTFEAGNRTPGRATRDGRLPRGELHAASRIAGKAPATAGTGPRREAFGRRRSQRPILRIEADKGRGEAPTQQSTVGAWPCHSQNGVALEARQFAILTSESAPDTNCTKYLGGFARASREPRLDCCQSVLIME